MKSLSFYVAAAMIWGIAPPLFAGSIHGQITLDGAVLAGPVYARLLRSDSHRPVQEAEVSSTGDFAFESIDSGDYKLQVVDGQANVLATDFVSAGDYDTFVTLRLPPASRVARPPSGSVSVRALRHKPPAKAIKEAARAQKAGRNPLEAVKHLKKAIELDPDYAEAHNNLGAVYYRGKQFKEAAAEFQAAANLEPDDPKINANLANALAAVNEFALAAEPARRALRGNPGDLRMKLILGLGLKMLGRGDEALTYLAEAASEFPMARLHCAELLARKRRLRAASQELALYLASAPKAENAPEVQRWLGELRAASGPAQAAAPSVRSVH